MHVRATWASCASTRQAPRGKSDNIYAKSFRKADWHTLDVFFKVAGGVALILFGVRYLRKGLDRLFGSRLGHWMQRLSGSKLRALLTGLGVSIVAPSSTTMSVLATETVQAGHINSRRMLAIMLGANIGLTVLVQLLALPLDEIAPVFLAVGVLLFQFTQASRTRGLGQGILALGFIFFGVFTIKDAFPVSDIAAGNGGDLQELINIAERHPLFMFILAAIMSMAMQSTTAVIALVIGMGASGAMRIPMTAALAWVAGANVGIGLTMMVLGWGAIESRRLAMGNLIAKVALSAILLAVLPWAAQLMERTPGDFTLQIANFHTIFNIVLAVLGLPLVEQISRLAEVMAPAPVKAANEQTFGPRHISNVPSESIALALGASMREILHVSEIVRGMLTDVWRALKTNNAALAQSVCERDDRVDLLDAQIKKFLTRLGSLETDPESAAEQMRQLRFLSELETIGDILDKNIAELVLKKIRAGVEFSPEGWQELDDFYNKVAENMMIADMTFTRTDPMLAQQLLRHKERLNQYERELRDRHFARLNTGMAQSHETSAIHLDLLTHLKRINSSLTHVAYATLDQKSAAH